MNQALLIQNGLLLFKSPFQENIQAIQSSNTQGCHLSLKRTVSHFCKRVSGNRSKPIYAQGAGVSSPSVGEVQMERRCRRHTTAASSRQVCQLLSLLHLLPECLCSLWSVLSSYLAIDCCLSPLDGSTSGLQVLLHILWLSCALSTWLLL